MRGRYSCMHMAVMQAQLQLRSNTSSRMRRCKCLGCVSPQTVHQPPSAALCPRSIQPSLSIQPSGRCQITASSKMQVCGSSMHNRITWCARRLVFATTHPLRRPQARQAAAVHASAGAAAAAAAAAAPEPPPPPPVDALFQGLCNASSIDCSAVSVKPISRDKGVGLVAARDIAAGEPILRVPRSMCIVIDNASGAMTIPSGDWPRLSGGLMQDNSLTWDVLQGLALMDAIAGDGDPFYQVYAEELLPQPEDLTLPMCWGDELLEQLQHPAIINAAREQQARLRSLLPPEYMTPIEPGLPSYLQWGFGCVRSRAFRLGAQAFGCVPFLDFANHTDAPNADLRVAAIADEGKEEPQPAAAAAGGSDGSDSSPSTSHGWVELVALSDIPAGSEVTMSYSGPAGFTNQRFMAQYGFVPPGGNVADRVELSIPDRLAGATLRLSHIEDALGASLLMKAAQGDNPYLLAALKSLPVQVDDVSAADAAAMAQQESSGEGSSSEGSASSSGRGIAPALPQEKELAGELLQQVQREAEAWPTSLEADEKLLLQLSMRPPLLPADTAAALGPLATDGRLLAAIKYRVERKRLLQACQVLLQLFVRD